MVESQSAIKAKGLVEWRDRNWFLTELGLEEGMFIVKSHRLYYLYYRSILDIDHVDRSADEVEHLLTPEIIMQIEKLLEKEEL